LEAVLENFPWKAGEDAPHIRAHLIEWNKTPWRTLLRSAPTSRELYA
jgi:hypothetical protein